jgi:hypothetical protein
MNFNKLRKIILKEMRLIESEQSEPKVEFPSWLENKIATIHGVPGTGSVFAHPASVKDIVLNVVSQNLDRIPKIANSSEPLLKATVPNIGYDLVLPYETAKGLSDPIETTAIKLEGPNQITVPAIKTSEPITKFSTDELTIVILPKKDNSGTLMPNEYIIVSAWPGGSTPRASEWNGNFAVIIPDQQVKNESRRNQSKVIFERWQKLAGILKG